MLVMKPGTVGGSIHIPAGFAQGLRSGEVVSVNVLKRLEADRWAVGIRGRVFPAVSDTELASGTRMRARVGFTAGRTILHLEKELPNGRAADTFRLALLRQGFPPGSMTETIAASLLRSGQPLQNEVMERMKAILSRTKLPAHRAARLAATIASKGMDLVSPAIDDLIALLSFGERDGDRERRKGRRMPENPLAVKQYIAALPDNSDSAPDALQVFNHLRGEAPSWIVVPFLFTSAGARLAGTMKLLYDPYGSRLQRFVLSASGIDFHLAIDGRRRRLAIFCSDPSLALRLARGLDSVKSKFHNMGVEVDDTIHEGNAFDGLCPAWEGTALRGVDTVG